MPSLTAAMQRWLRTPFSKARYLNLGGSLGIAAILGCVTLLFRQIFG
jgi:nitrate reductase gamma subunit